MPGENLQKLNKRELKELRACVRKIYFEDEGFTPEEMKRHITNRECDKLIDSLLPSTIESCRQQGVARGFIARKKFFLPTRIVGVDGKKLKLETSD